MSRAWSCATLKAGLAALERHPQPMKSVQTVTGLYMPTHAELLRHTFCSINNTDLSRAKVKEEPHELEDMGRGLSPESKRLVSQLDNTPQSRLLVEKLLQAKQGNKPGFLLATNMLSLA